MVSQDKLIREGLKLTEAWYKRFLRKDFRDIIRMYELCDTWEEFLERTEKYMVGNVFYTDDYTTNMQNIVINSIRGIRFQRATQRELVETVIRNNVANLIVDVGDDLRETVRAEVSRAYTEGYGVNQLQSELRKEITTLKNTRLKAIARTEVKRADTIAGYVVAKEDGATGFRVVCRPDCCPYCAKEYADLEGADYEALTDDKGKPIDNHLIGGEKRYDIEDTDKLPPWHVSCRCSVYYDYD